jgi:adenylate cyclase
LGIEQIFLADLSIQPSHQATIFLHYSRSLANRYIPAWKVFANQVNKQDIENHIVFIGVSAKGLQDLRFNPFGHLVAGIEIHAQLAEQLLQQSYLIRPDWESFATVGLLVLVWSIFSVLNNKASGNRLAVIGLISITLTITSTWLAFTQARLLIDPLFPSLSIILLFTVFFFQKQLKTEKEKRWLRTAFGRYVSPNRVDYLIKHPDSLVLGGEYRECSFVITDLTDFTALMEKLPPHECVTVLNHYLEGMIEIVFNYQGTLDRIVGDSVAVIFSAPILQPDHCQRALDCALAMDAYAMQFVSEKHDQSVAFGITRIGVCTGNVLIGNFGGKIMFDYRALGDPINIASRLESANKQFGTRLCVAESTLNQTDYRWFRPIGQLVLQGKLKKIKAFELLTESAFNSALTSEYLHAYHKMEAGDSSALAAFHTLVECYPEDILSAYHYYRLHQNVHFVRCKEDSPLSIDSTIVLANK